jgi:cytochrome c biogenesis protein CcmG, thiol:disulfide interchange protein DsbE
MRASVLLGILAGLLVVVIAVGAAVTLLPDLAPSAVSNGSPAPTARDASESGSPVAIPATPPPSAAPAPSGSLLPGSSAEPAAPSSTSVTGIGVAVGQAAPALVADRLGGGTVNLADLRGTPVWVNFMATWCPPCRDELPLMAGYSAKLGDRLAIVLVDVREDGDTVAAFMKALKLDFPVALDESGHLQRGWSAYALPIHFWIDADGIVRGFAYGGLGPPLMEEGIRKVLPDALPTPALTGSAEPGTSGAPAGEGSPVPSEAPAADGSASPTP